MRKIRNLEIDITTWRVIKRIKERVRQGTIVGTKYSFIARGNVEEKLNERRELRFNYDAFPIRAVIKATGRATNALGVGKRIRNFVKKTSSLKYLTSGQPVNELREAERVQKAFERYWQEQQQQQG